MGKDVKNLEEFQSLIMSQALFREFVDIYGINLYWIDTNYDSNQLVRSTCSCKAQTVCILQAC